jgi:hypothetical protein
MATFCRKVNIPFDVYGFTDNSHAAAEFTEAGEIGIASAIASYYDARSDSTSSALNINTRYFRMKQLVHSTMRTVEFNDAIKNLLLLAHTFSAACRPYYSESATIPPTMRLAGTPLDEAIMVLRYIAEKFKKDTKIEILNTIILTDGESSYSLATPRTEHSTYSIILEDPNSSKPSTIVSRHSSGTLAYLEMYKNITGSRVIGFYLMSGRNYRTQIMRRASMSNLNTDFEKQYKNEFLQHRYFGLKTKGYDTYFMVPGNDLEIDNITMDTVLVGPKNKATLLKAFKKMQTSKSISRVFLNQFIQQVS